ncbi:MAG: methionyl-tRNA formyltransferase, partial [Gemmatimonadota bacterium]|nr:methionyl-tRNA formyltransferase [Gemmatimonadota bacterium]
MRVLFWGTPAFALPAFRALSEEGHDVVGVVTQPDRPSGRRRALIPSPVRAVAVAEGIPVLQPERARGAEFEAALRALRPEISVVVAFGQILRPEILELPPLGSINLHASLLPELRGAAPIQWAVARGKETTGVSIMRMEAGLDSGPILLQVAEPIRPDESAGELASRLAEVGAEAMIATLVLLATDAVEEQPQRHELATHAPKLNREAARVEWHRSAGEVARWIRATDPAPGAWSPLDGRGPV